MPTYFQWISSHVGFCGNADVLAKEGVYSSSTSNTSLTFLEVCLEIQKSIPIIIKTFRITPGITDNFHVLPFSSKVTETSSPSLRGYLVDTLNSLVLSRKVSFTAPNVISCNPLLTIFQIVQGLIRQASILYVFSIIIVMKTVGFMDLVQTMWNKSQKQQIDLYAELNLIYEQLLLRLLASTHIIRHFKYPFNILNSVLIRLDKVVRV